MKRRDFLKLIGIAPIAPSVLAAMPKKELTVATAREFVNKIVPPKVEDDDILGRLRDVINKTSYRDLIFVSPDMKRRLTAAFETTCFSPVCRDGFKRTERFMGIPIYVNSVLEDDEIIIMNNSFNKDFFIRPDFLNA